MKTTKIALILAVSLLAATLTSCGGGGGGGGVAGIVPQTTGTPAAPGGAAASAVTLAGRVVDTSGNPISGVTVTLPGGGSATTGAAGEFSYSPGSATEVKVSAVKGGYIDAFDTFTLNSSAVQNGKISVTVTMSRAASTAAEATSASITRADGSSAAVAPTAVSSGGLTVYESVVQVGATDRAVEFTSPAPSATEEPSVKFTIGSADGSGANAASVLGKTGNITASISYGSPLEAADLAIFPGNFTTQSSTGSGPAGDGILVTAGFAKITLKDSAGNPITKFADGQSAQIEMTVPDGVANPETGLAVKTGDTIPIFVFNESTGEWIVEHNADNSVKRSTVQQDNTGRMYVQFTTTHLTWFNLDWKGALCAPDTPRVSFVDDKGSPVSGVYVHTQTGGWGDGMARYTAESYATFYRAPSDISWKVWAEKDGKTSQVSTVTACKDTTVVFITPKPAEPPKPACSSASECNDNNVLTTDKCISPGELFSYCLNNACSAVCSSSAQCDDGKSSTIDSCSNAGTCSAFCKHEACSIACSSDAACSDGNALTTDTCSNAGTCSAACAHSAACTPACSSGSQCDDGNALTTDTCSNSGTCNASCSHAQCSIACSADSGCDDGNALTIDTCGSAGTCSASCSHTSCNVACASDAACNDGNALTTDACSNAGTCSAACSHTACSVACSTNAECDDSNPNTTDSCSNGGTCSAACSHPAATCALTLNKVNYAPGETMTITFTASNAGSSPMLCGAESALKRGQGSASWNSFSENLYVTVPANTVTTTLTMQKVVPLDWTGTDTSQGSDYDLYPVHFGGERWASGDNFNLHFKRAVCSANTECDDNNAATTDTCVNPGLYDSACVNAACNPVCVADAGCDDGNPLTLDVCGAPATCAAACSNTACTPACTADANCNDGNPLTSDSCSSPNTCSAACSFTPCAAACINDANCDDSNPLTLDACSNPNTCSASCANTACTPACTADANCDDSNALTNDSCSNPNTCSAACVNAACTPACTTDANCDDSNALTNDSCSNPNTCSAACVNTSCTPACTADGDCNDSNALTNDSCSNPNTCSAACAFTACTPACTADGDCNDSNALTNDSCGAPNTCSAACINTACTPVCVTDADCDDSNATTIDTCSSPNTCASSCANTPIPNFPPTSTAAPSITTGEIPLTIGFTGTCSDSDGVCLSYSWNFGDGSPAATTLNASHTYSVPGAYTVTLTATDDEGATGTATTSVSTYQSPSGTITPSVNTGVSPLSVDFTSTCVDDGTCVSYSWDFGDGSPFSTLQNPSHTFTSDGVVSVSLTLTDNDGRSRTVYSIITVGSNPAKVAAGTNHACAITPGGGAKCWGQNNAGQLGNSTYVNSATPVNVTGLTTGVTTVAAGASHTCVITSAGAARCWGQNTNGQLGDGSVTTTYSPLTVSGFSSGVVAISAGGSHTCAITSAGGVKCWGLNSSGQLGDGSTTQRTTPVDVPGLSSGVIAISAGASHTCAITAAAGAKCWGLNSSGQLGNGATVNSSTPVDVSGLTSGAAAISASGSHTCAISSSGGAKCWGLNSNGQLGNATTVNSSTPVDVSGLTSGAAYIAALKGNHTCSITVGGGVKCWGQNANSQLGNASTIQSLIPVDVSGLTSGVSSAAAGSTHTCAMLSDGSVKCWGLNSFGQTGGTLSPASKTTPTNTTLSSGVSFISTGNSYSCAIVSGALDCWGLNTSGQLGDSSITTRGFPVAVSGMSSGITQASSGLSHTCSVNSSGAIQCWGLNSNGQLGNGSTTASYTPVNVTSLTSGGAAVANGYYHSCALTTSGGVKCWGYNFNGQLGNASTTQSTVPVNVTGLTSGGSAIGSGSSFSCALTTGGAVKCWGQNNYGQLGNASTTQSTVPVNVTGLTSGVSAIAIGSSQACALTSSGGVKCWGYNGYGSLGNGTTVNSSVPVDVTGMSSGVASLASGSNHTCAVMLTGALKCWGINDFGEIGNGTTVNSSVPVDVTGMSSGVVSVSGGGQGTCAIISGGSLKCWGINNNGQLALPENDTSTPETVAGF